jgi:hypothetical protein
MSFRCGHKHRGENGYFYQCVRKPGHWFRHLDVMGWRWK